MDTLADWDMQSHIAKLIRRNLESVREAISRELCTIPTPIAGCDVHVNRLLEDRAKVVDDLQRFSRLLANAPQSAELIDFARSCAWLDQSTRDEIARLTNCVADLPQSRP